MVLLASSYDQSKFLRAEDVPQEKTLKIKGVSEETMADQSQKLVVWFTNSKKGLPLNRTNNRTIRGAYSISRPQVPRRTHRRAVLLRRP